MGDTTLFRSASSLRSLWGLSLGRSCNGSRAIAKKLKLFEVGFVGLGVLRESDERDEEKERSGLEKGLKGEHSSMGIKIEGLR